MKNVSEGSGRENQVTQFVFKTSWRKSCCLWDNMVERDRPQMAIEYIAERVRLARRITKAKTQTYTQNM